eukprot:jgi/Mesen1/9379/ME000610S08685
MCFGALSCTIEDANLGGPQEQEIFAVPWGPKGLRDDDRKLWKEGGGGTGGSQSQIVALYAAECDVAQSIAAAATSLGLRDVPLYRLGVAPTNDNWIQHVKEPEAVNVVLDPGLAFGTGDHPTTRLCLHHVARCVQPGHTVLDYGCGSGILSIAALRFGAARAVGIDIDPLAVSSAQYNASLNGFDASCFRGLLTQADDQVDPVPSRDTLAAWQGMPSSGNEGLESASPAAVGGGDYDVVVANILVNPLVALAGRLAGHVRLGGALVLSGILEEQVETVKAAYAPQVRITAVTNEGGWACILGTRVS